MAERGPMERGSGREGQELPDRSPQERCLLERGERLETAPERAHGGCDVGEILTLPEAAELLRVSPRGLQRLVREGAVPFAMVGGLLRFRRTRLLAWLDSGGTLPSLGGALGRSAGRRRAGRKSEPDVLGVLAGLGAEAISLDSGPGSG